MLAKVLRVSDQIFIFPDLETKSIATRPTVRNSVFIEKKKIVLKFPVLERSVFSGNLDAYNISKIYRSQDAEFFYFSKFQQEIWLQLSDLIISIGSANLFLILFRLSYEVQLPVNATGIDDLCIDFSGLRPRPVPTQCFLALPRL